MKFTWMALLVCTVAVATLAAQSSIRAGRWETTAQVQIPDLPVQMPDVKATECMNPDQLEKDPGSLLPEALRPGRGNSSECKVSNTKVSGGTVTWRFTCTGEQAMTGTGEITFAGDTFTGTMTMATDVGAVTAKMTGKRVGDCTQ
jgi:hypothetical protein